MSINRARFELVPGQHRIGQVVGRSHPADKHLQLMSPDQIRLAKQGVIGFAFEQQLASALKEGGMRKLLHRPVRTKGFSADPTTLFGGIQFNDGNCKSHELDAVLLFDECPVYVEYKSGGSGRAFRFARLEKCYGAMRQLCVHLGHIHPDDDFRAGLAVITPSRTLVDFRNYAWEVGVRRNGGAIYRTPDTFTALQSKIIRLIQQRSRR